MTTRILRPDLVTLRDLDRFLAEGWYRIGLHMVTHQYVIFEGTLRSVVWTRLPLHGYTMRRGLARQVRKVQDRFELRWGPAQVDAQREALYQRYLQAARGERPDDLHGTLFGDDEAEPIFDTQELSIWDGDRLVAFSWFDVGHESLQSLQGIYDPAHARYSLGFVTMLLEVQWAQQQGLAYHYAGYVLPGESAMDYKLRLGGLEAWDFPTRTWVPWDAMPPTAHPLERLGRALDDAAALIQPSAPAERVQYRFFELPAQHPEAGHLVDQPLFLRVGARRVHQVLVLWHLSTCTYEVITAMRTRRQAILRGDAQRTVTIELWAKTGEITRTRSVIEAARAAVDALDEAG